MLDNPLGQFFGMLSFIIGVSAFYQRDDRKLKILMFVLQINHTIHFILMGATTAALSSVLSAIRTGLSLKTSSKIVAWLFIAFTLALGSYIASDWRDYLPIIGTCIGTYSLFCLEGIRMRLAFLLGACFWLSNNIVIGSVGGTLLETTLIVVNLRTIVSLYRRGLVK